MVLYKKIDKKAIVNIKILLVVFIISVIGLFFLVGNISSFKNMFILATTVQPETFTELFFEHHLSLPSRINLYQENKFQFTIGNLEYKDMEYIYELFLMIDQKKQIIDKGTVFIKKGEYRTISEQFTIKVPAPKIKVVINLINKNQQIHFWMEN